MPPNEDKKSHLHTEPSSDDIVSGTVHKLSAAVARDIEMYNMKAKTARTDAESAVAQYKKVLAENPSNKLLIEFEKRKAMASFRRMKQMEQYRDSIRRLSAHRM